MLSNYRLYREPLRNGLLVLLFLAAFVSACGPFTTASSSPTPTATKEISSSPTSTPTSTTIQGIRGIFHEYALPQSQFVPLSIATGPDSNLWFTEIMQGASGIVQTSKIERITPTGTLSELSLPSANSLATEIIAGPDGSLWFIEQSKIGHITTSDKITEFPLPQGSSSITAGPDGNLWFTEQSKIGRMTLTGKVSEFSLPFHQYPAGPSPKSPGGSAQGQPLAIAAGPGGNLWFTEIMQNGGSSIGRITTAGKITEFSLPSSNTFASSITAGLDGNIWFTETGVRNGPSKIGVITPQGKIREFTLPHSILGSITRGPEGVLWFTEYQYGGTGKIASITTTGKISEFPLPTSGYDAGSITFGTDHTLWFTEDKIDATHPLGENGKIGHLV